MPLLLGLSLVALLFPCIAAWPYLDVGAPLQGIKERTDDPLTVHTSSGIVHGAINESAPHVRHFLGVPFAQSPVGSLRFQLPQALPLNASSQSLSGSGFGPNCPQYESTTPSLYNKIVREFFISGDTGDDCLLVSIWAPLNPIKDKVPVILWLYGGGDSTGGSTVPYQNPQNWVERSQGHIVVSIQYRLNFFGFPNAPAPGLDAPLAFYDVRAAMEWTRNNIGAFGGDTSKMVLWGQSAGAAQTGLQSLAYLDDPIVTGYIQDSGASWGTFSSFTDTTHSNFTFIAEHFGCTGNATAKLECLQATPQADLESFFQYWTDTGKKPALSFEWDSNNQTGGTWLNATLAYLSGSYSKLPKILGNNQDGISFAPFPAYPYDIGPNASAILAADLSFRCAAADEAEERTRLDLTTYRFSYYGNFSNISPKPWMGAYHSSELPMLFGTYNEFRSPGTTFEKSTSEIMQDMWLAFAEDPENGPSSLGWPKYSGGLIEGFGLSNITGDYANYTFPKAELEAICETYNGSFV